ncbi:hypothetical protein ACHAWC_010196 [Mediolabrus comicus]
MLTYPLALTALIGSAAAAPRATKKELIRSIRKENLDPKILASVAKSSASLTKTITENAIVVPPGRKLENAANNNAYANNKNYNYVYNQQYGTDDYGSWNQNFAGLNEWGFDASQYSLSYERCATVEHFDLEQAAQEDSTSPFRKQHFAVLRLCPFETCDDPNWWMADEEEEAGDRQLAEADTTVYGATGTGCSSNYATFMLDAGLYMELMMDYEDVQFEMYCNYCDHIYQKAYQKYIQNGGHRSLEEFKTDSEFQFERHLGGIPDSCVPMQKLCQNTFEDDLSEYFNCAEVQKDNGMVAYSAATCAADGETITLGLFADPYCSQDISQYTNIANWIGQDVNDEDMAHYYKKVHSALAELLESYGVESSANPDAVCIPCKQENQAWYDGYDEANNQYHRDDEKDGYTSEEGISDICTAVFQNSIRCEKTMRSYWKHALNPTYAESVALQDLTCNYIDLMRMGNYDTEGYVVQDKNRLYKEGATTGLQGNVYFAEYGQGIAKVSPLQYFLLIASIVACVALAYKAVDTHKSMSNGGLKWKPKRGVSTGDAADADKPQDDPIVMGRSTSNHTSYYMS